MRKSKLYEVFERLSPAERRSFLSTMKLKENNLSQNDQDLVQRYTEEIVNRRFPQGEVAFWEANAMKPLAANKFKTRVLRALERYLLLDALDKEPRLRHILLAGKYDHLGFRKHLDYHLRELEKEQYSHEEQIIGPYLGETLGQHILIKARSEEERSNAQLGYADMRKWGSALEKFSDYMRMSLLLETYNRIKVYGGEEENVEDIREKIQTIVGQTKDENIKYFGQLVRVLDQCPPEEYLEIAKEPNGFDKEVANVYQKQYWATLFNYCVDRLNINKDRRFAGELVKIIKQLEDRNLHLNDGHTIQLARINGAMSAAVISGEIGWFLDFLNRNWDKVALASRKERDAYRHFSLAYSALYRGDISNAHQYIHIFQRSVLYSKTSYSNFAMRIGSDKVLSKIYFENQEFIALERQIRSVRGYVTRSQYPPHVQQGLMSFFDDLLSCSQNSQPFTSERIQGWPLIDQVWGEQVLAKGKGPTL